jgi:hypothetical protein
MLLLERALVLDVRRDWDANTAVGDRLRLRVLSRP